MNEPQTYSLRARYIFPMDRPPLRDAWLTVVDGKIAALGKRPDAAARDLGKVAILPCAINAHTHLEFSGLTRPLGNVGMDFTAWIREVVAWRRATAGEHPHARHDAVEQGLRESFAAGCSMLGEIATLPWLDRPAYADLRGVVFLELLGMSEERERELLQFARQFATGSADSSSFRLGFSPHAPYTVSLHLVHEVSKLSAEKGLPVAMHLAETREEIELLRAGGGPFRDLLMDLDAWHPHALQPARRPFDYLRALSKADRSLVIHGNFLDQDEIELLARHRETMSLVYCPRTHAYFAHEPYPLAELLRNGVRVALGTDSKASTPDLNVWRELQFAARQHAEISPKQLFELCTRNAAEALGVAAQAGTLCQGMPADFTVVALSDETQADPYESLLASLGAETSVYRAGRLYDEAP